MNAPDPGLDPALSRIEQFTIPMRTGLTAYVGHNPTAAQYVADMTGDAIGFPYRTVGFVDDEDRSLVAVLHNVDVGPRRGEVSFVHDGLSLSRDVLIPFAVLAFDELEMEFLFVRVRPSDLDTRATLARLGFIIAARIPGPTGDRIVMMLTPSTLPESYRRSRLRRSQ